MSRTVCRLLAPLATLAMILCCFTGCGIFGQGQSGSGGGASGADPDGQALYDKGILRMNNIKIDEIFDLDYDVLGYVDSNITVNIVRDNRLDKKLHMELPEKLVNVVKCKNPRCITSVEQEIVHEFRLVDKEKKIYRCCYCDAEHRVK